ncbi:type II toxin-antitoxin system HicB family antitoxin [Pleurocapsales cyanobacterium LEGE 10410]|nr:type II toxin-antitoxin system HicB family antitoxin [Pleurocapsales cyanobacterium LEGE 10410]
MYQKYSFNLRYSEEDAGYIAICPEFPGLSAFGDTPEEAIEEAKVALELFIDTYKEENKPLPEPSVTKEHSGQIRIRLPKSLHQRLAMQAEEEGTSINTLMIQYISEGLSSTNTEISYKNLIQNLLESYQNHRWNLRDVYSKQLLRTQYSFWGLSEQSSLPETAFFSFSPEHEKFMPVAIKEDTEDKIETI